MRKKLRQFIKNLNLFSLHEVERVALREQMVVFLQAHPVKTKKSTSWFRLPVFSLISYRRFMFVTLTVLILFAVSGTAAFAAEGSLPGDVLYPIKIHLNEEVRTAITLSAQGKADWEVKRTERRLDEAESLAKKGRLNSITSVGVARQLGAQLDKVEKKIEKLQSEGKNEVAESLNKNIRASVLKHKKQLEILDDNRDYGDSKDSKDNYNDNNDNNEQTPTKNNAALGVTTTTPMAAPKNRLPMNNRRQDIRPIIQLMNTSMSAEIEDGKEILLQNEIHRDSTSTTKVRIDEVGEVRKREGDQNSLEKLRKRMEKINAEVRLEINDDEGK